MNRHFPRKLLTVSPLLALAFSARAADRFFDAGAANIATNGDGAATYAAGTWNTTLTNWDQGAGQAHVAWDNANLDNAVFGGTYSTGTKIVDLTANVTVNQIRLLTGQTAANRMELGTASGETSTVTFGGTYSAGNISIDASGALNTQINFVIPAGTIAGGLVIRDGNPINSPGTAGRFHLTNAANAFTGDVTVVGGNFSAGANMGNAANKLALQGGALFVSGGAAVTSTFSRSIAVNAASGIGTNAATAGLQVLQLTGAVAGSGNLTRYAAAGGTAISDVRLQGDMSGYTGIFENTLGTGGTVTNNLLTIQTTATSGGGWKLSGGTTRLATAGADAAIANGTGRSDLLMNGGTLDMNGRTETINGLSGATGFVQNELAATTAVLTLGDGNASATFGGTIRNNPGTGGTLSLTKIGAGTQTLGGTSTYSGLTTVTAGTLVISGSLTVSSLSISGTLGGSGTIGGSASLSGGIIDPGGDSGDRSLAFNAAVGGTGTLSLTIDSPSAYDKITGTGLLDATAISLNVTMNDTGWIAATDAAGLATATRYDIVSNPVTGNFSNGTSLTPDEQAYWGVGADAKFFNFGGQDFLLTTGSFKLTAVTPVPEPGPLVSVLALAVLGAARRRRRQRPARA